ncbi:hypothetical protein ACN47E_002285 [Coniothyrium glycines]
MEAPIPRQISLDASKDHVRTTTLKRKGSTLQTSVEVLRCKFGNRNRQPEGLSEVDQHLGPSKDWTPIYHAIYHQREAALLHFLRTGESPNDTTGTGQPPLCIAIVGGNLEIVRILLEAGADVNTTAKTNNESPLHIAIRLNRHDLIDLLLRYSPDLQAQTEEGGETPLHYAASKSGSLATVVTLLKSGAKYDILNTKGQTPAEAALLANNLHAAVAIINAAPRKRSKLAKEKELLLKHVQKTNGRFSIGNDLIADIFSAACDPDTTVLVEAIKRDDASLVEMFLEKGYDPDRETARGDRPIFVALDCAGAPVVQALVKHNVDVQVRNSKGSTTLQAAFDGPFTQDKEAMSAIVDALLGKGSNHAATFPDGRTLLHLAVSPQYGHTRVAHLLISAGVKVNAQDNDGNTALHIATHSKACVEVLLKNGAKPHIVNLDGLTPLLFASTHNSKEREPDLEPLIRASDLRKTSPSGQTALHLAASNGLEKSIRSLLRARAETTIVDSNKNTPLLLAVKDQQWTVVPLLTIPPSINSWDQEGMSALHHIATSTPKAPATWKDIATAIAPFCERGVSRSMRDRSGATPLIQAVKTLPEEGLPVIEALLLQKTDRGASRNCVSHENHQKRDALYYAATMTKPVFVEALLKHGAVFEFKDWVPKNKWLDATVDANKRTMRVLAQYEWARRAGSLRRQSSASDAEAPTYSKVFPTKEVKQMITMGLDVNALPKSPLGTSMLWAILRHIPAQPPMPPAYLFDAIKLGLDSGADANAGTARGTKRSPSPQSPQASRDSMPLSLHPLTFLLEECPTVDIDLISLFLTKGAKLSIASPFYNGRLPLHSAVQANRMDIVDEFLFQRADVNAEDQTGRAALFIAAEKGYWEIVDSLLRRGAKVNVQDNERNSPLHAAAVGGSKRIVAALLRAGAKASVKNNKDLTPLACVAEDLVESEKDKIIPMLKNAEQNETRDTDRQKQQPEQDIAHEARVKQRQADETKAKLRRAEEEKAMLQKKQQESLNRRKELEKQHKPTIPAKPTTPSKQSSSIFKKPSLLFARPKVTPPPSTTLPKQTSVVMRLTTPPKPSLPTNNFVFTTTHKATSPAPQPTSTPSIAISSPKSSNPSTLTVPAQKPLRVDSGIGPSTALDKPLPPLDRAQGTLGGALDADALVKALNSASSRDSGHELKDWLAMSRMIDNL